MPGFVFGRRPKTCRPAADEAPRHTRETVSGTQGNQKVAKGPSTHRVHLTEQILMIRIYR